MAASVVKSIRIPVGVWARMEAEAAKREMSPNALAVWAMERITPEQMPMTPVQQEVAAVVLAKAQEVVDGFRLPVGPAPSKPGSRLKAEKGKK